MKPIFLSLFAMAAVIAIRCTYSDEKSSGLFSIAHHYQNTSPLNNLQGTNPETRFNVPDGFERVKLTHHSFGNYLRHLPLKVPGSKVKYFNGQEKDDKGYIAVVDMDIGQRDLQQCADAVMRLRGEYFYKQKKYDSISFTLTNGFRADYTQWMAGNRLRVQGNQASWIKTKSPSNTYEDFRNYMDMVFTYAGTLSLSKILHSKRVEDIAIGDVFIIGGSPGHAVLVVDMAESKKGEKLFMLAQSYMPAQDIQVLRNLDDEIISPWYRDDFAEKLVTPDWVFTREQLKTW